MTDDNFDFDKLVEAAAQRAEQKRQQHEANGADALPDADLARMNKDYAVVQIGGKTRVMWREESPVQKGCRIAVYAKLADFAAFHNREKKTVLVDGKLKQVGMGAWWISHPERTQYDGVVYAPNRSPVGKLNLWEGFACEPAKGGCGRYLDHLFHVVCRGNDEHCNYFLNFMAHNVQYPDRPGGVAVVLRGPEGGRQGHSNPEFWLAVWHSLPARRAGGAFGGEALMLTCSTARAFMPMRPSSPATDNTRVR